MSKLDGLISKFCPDGVEYISLENCCDYVDYRGKTPKKTDRGIFLVTAKNIRQGYIDYESSKEYVSSDDYEEIMHRGLPEIGDVLFTTEAPCGFVAQIDNDKVALAQRVIKYRGHKGILNNSFLKYVLLGEEFQTKLHKISTGSTVEGIKGSRLHKMEIPVPPLEVQNEIVRILDKFTSLEAELEAELEARRKQYEYYRDSLLTFGDDVEWSSLGDNAIVTKLAGFEFTEHVRYQDSGEIIALRGLNVKKGHLVLDDVKYIDGSNFEKLNRSKLFINDMLFTYVGTVGQVALIDKNEKYYLAPNVALIRFQNKQINPEFMKFYFQTYHFQRFQIDKYSGSSSMKNLTMENIRKFSIPIPELEIQNKIVKILTNFEIMTEDISSGLPAEIEARHKQYEYYRDKLLTFKRKEAV